jgi:hypothetical protein
LDSFGFLVCLDFKPCFRFLKNVFRFKFILFSVILSKNSEFRSQKPILDNPKSWKGVGHSSSYHQIPPPPATRFPQDNYFLLYILQLPTSFFRPQKSRFSSGHSRDSSDDGFSSLAGTRHTLSPSSVSSFGGAHGHAGTLPGPIVTNCGQSDILHKRQASAPALINYEQYEAQAFGGAGGQPGFSGVTNPSGGGGGGQIHQQQQMQQHQQFHHGQNNNVGGGGGSLKWVNIQQLGMGGSIFRDDQNQNLKKDKLWISIFRIRIYVSF